MKKDQTLLKEIYYLLSKDPQRGESSEDMMHLRAIISQVDSDRRTKSVHACNSMEELEKKLELIPHARELNAAMARMSPKHEPNWNRLLDLYTQWVLKIAGLHGNDISKWKVNHAEIKMLHMFIEVNVIDEELAWEVFEIMWNTGNKNVHDILISGGLWTMGSYYDKYQELAQEVKQAAAGQSLSWDQFWEKACEMTQWKLDDSVLRQYF